jgi:hypothetical protein
VAQVSLPSDQPAYLSDLQQQVEKIMKSNGQKKDN